VAEATNDEVTGRVEGVIVGVRIEVFWIIRVLQHGREGADQVLAPRVNGQPRRLRGGVNRESFMDALPPNLPVVADWRQGDFIALERLAEILSYLPGLDTQRRIAKDNRLFGELPVSKRSLPDRLSDFSHSHVLKFQLVKNVRVIVR
jgi:hypothetical protein